MTEKFLKAISTLKPMSKDERHKFIMDRQMNNIFAYTETNGKSYPGYISLNERDGKYFLTVRGTGMQCGQEIEVPPEELLKLEAGIFKWVG